MSVKDSAVPSIEQIPKECEFFSLQRNELEHGLKGHREEIGKEVSRNTDPLISLKQYPNRSINLYGSQQAQGCQLGGGGG